MASTRPICDFYECLRDNPQQLKDFIYNRADYVGGEVSSNSCFVALTDPKDQEFVRDASIDALHKRMTAEECGPFSIRILLTDDLHV